MKCRVNNKLNNVTSIPLCVQKLINHPLRCRATISILKAEVLQNVFSEKRRKKLLSSINSCKDPRTLAMRVWRAIL